MLMSFKGVGIIYKAFIMVLFTVFQITFLKFWTVKEQCNGIVF